MYQMNETVNPKYFRTLFGKRGKNKLRLVRYRLASLLLA